MRLLCPFLLCLLLTASLTHAEKIAWRYPPGLRQTGFVLYGCLQRPEGDVCRDLQRVGPARRQAVVQRSGRAYTFCIWAYAVRGDLRSARSNPVCLP